MSDDEPQDEIARPPWLDRLRGGVSEVEVTKDEVEAARREIEAQPKMGRSKTHPDGWTPERLAAYYKGRGGLDFTPTKQRRRPTRTNGLHNPHRWRR